MAPAPTPLPAGTRRLLAVTGVERNGIPPHTDEADVVCLLEPPGVQRPRRRLGVAGPGVVAPVLEPLTEEQWFWRQLARLSACIGRETQPRGGLLLHSGLAAYPDLSGFGNLTGLGGILLAGRSGVGKSTASRHLPPPWRSLADDVTLIVRDEEETYWAHPWPTWSWFFGKEDYRPGGGVWDVQQAVPLRAIFILEQGEDDRVEPMGPAHALCTLTELAQQTSRRLLYGLPLDEIGAFNLQRFENLCALVRAVPAYLLHVSRRGAFWDEISRALQ